MARVTQIWIHIGTPKTGTTAIQKYGAAQAGYLRGRGVAFVNAGARSSLNQLAIALRNGNTGRATQIGQAVCNSIADAAPDHAVLSSEMFWGCNPARVRDVLPLGPDRPVNIIAYLRRQDLFFESMWAQKVKTGRTSSGFAGYLERVAPGAGHYDQTLRTWEDAFPAARLHIRRYERPRLSGGNAVTDFLSLMGVADFPDGTAPGKPQSNTPGIDELELLRRLRKAGIENGRDIWLNLHQSQGGAAYPAPRGRLLDAREARDLMAQYADANERVRQRYFPDAPELFDMSDIDDPNRETCTSFSDAQFELIERVFDAIAKSAPKP